MYKGTNVEATVHPGLYGFGPYRLDPHRRRLTKESEDLRVTPRVFDVLLYLVEHRDHVVTKAELLDAVWGRIVVEEGSLTQAIHQLRRLLGELPREHRYIVTVPARGYRFVADVRLLERPRPALDPQHATRVGTLSRLRPAPGLVAATLSIAAAWAVAAVALLTPDATNEAGTVPTMATVRTAEARFYLGRRAPSDLDRAEAALREALRQDPGSAEVWSGLASVHAIRAGLEPEHQAAELRRMRDAAERALLIDRNQVEAWMRLAWYHCVNGHDAEARRLFDVAASIAPEDPLLLGVRAGIAAQAGRFEAAVRLQQAAVRQQPVNAVGRLNLAHFLYSLGRLDDARQQYHAVVDLAGPAGATAIALEAATYIVRIDVAGNRLDDARLVAATLPAGPERDYSLALIESATGDRAAADALLARVLSEAGDERAYLLAEAYAFRGDVDAAFHWLDVAARARAKEREPHWEVRTSPLLANARHDPRWRNWLAANFETTTARL